ncbi:hypothetical protein GLOTRDRAFT_130958 [Gloeophyllum trabeum ATCC 11539]|uniref:C2H2-type domain-containing protein n=1 Tax=Gloeophyllum trabeum (strain ATCC 11539 / FP-39264 / Madison 617) TaxID=670483 RepID=S7RH88_GLOTA|nr:uncharacterized protein GLOTRDRAFT_130958 [Gloeophyllum trabeum ATCC 11539]EPQ53620.1 hypothetical protein GLOTRDRAFT_130958 [Gloeophyllum trabeum ATCC 11539]
MMYSENDDDSIAPSIFLTPPETPYPSPPASPEPEQIEGDHARFEVSDIVESHSEVNEQLGGSGTTDSPVILDPIINGQEAGEQLGIEPTGPTQPQATPEILLCSSCNREYKTKTALEQHYRDTAAHRDEPAVYCNNCRRKYPSQKALEQHYRDTVGHEIDGTFSDVSPVYCPTCGRRYASQRAMEQHWKDTVGHAPPNYVRSSPPAWSADDHLRCSACTRKYRTRQALEQHCKDSAGHSPLVATVRG